MDLIDLKEQFWIAKTKEQLAESIEWLVEHSPREAWELFRQALDEGEILAATDGFARLQEPKAIPLLSRVYSERGGTYSEMKMILECLARLKATEALLLLAEDPYARPDLRNLVLEHLSGLYTPEAAKLFLKELEAPQKERQKRAIYYIGKWRISEGINRLRILLRQQVRTSLREPLLWALAQFSELEAMTALRESLKPSSNSGLHFKNAMFLTTIHRRKLISLLEGILVHLGPEEQSRLGEAIQGMRIAFQKQFQEEIKPWKENMEEALFWDL